MQSGQQSKKPRRLREELGPAVSEVLVPVELVWLEGKDVVAGSVRSVEFDVSVAFTSNWHEYFSYTNPLGPSCRMVLFRSTGPTQLPYCAVNVDYVNTKLTVTKGHQGDSLPRAVETNENRKSLSMNIFSRDIGLCETIPSEKHQRMEVVYMHVCLADCREAWSLTWNGLCIR